jgi:hypothetical protein
VVSQPRAYDLDVDEFIEFLKQGVENYKKGQTVFTIPE